MFLISLCEDPEAIALSSSDCARAVAETPTSAIAPAKKANELLPIKDAVTTAIQHQQHPGHNPRCRGLWPSNHVVTQSTSQASLLNRQQLDPTVLSPAFSVVVRRDKIGLAVTARNQPVSRDAVILKILRHCIRAFLRQPQVVLGAAD